MTTVGWYVHHHGHGHRTRFLAVRPHLDADVVVFSTMPPPAAPPDRTEWVVLPRDDDGEVRGDVTVGGLLHWAPQGHAGHRSRLATIARLVDERGVAGMVVDVSVEVALFGRLLGIPIVVIAQPGDRTDEPHALAYRAATRIVAPWPAGMVASAALDAAADRVVHVGGISRFDGRPRTVDPVPGTVFVLGDTTVDAGVGGGGGAGAGAGAGDVAGVEWTVADAAWVDDPWPALCGAEIVVSAAGQNAVADLAAAGARAVVVPQSRPFDEQFATASALTGHGLAMVTARADARALADARDLRPDWSVWRVAGAARRAAAAIADAFEQPLPSASVSPSSSAPSSSSSTSGGPE